MSRFEEDFEPYRTSDAHDEMDARFGWGLRNNEVHHLRKQVEELAAANAVIERLRGALQEAVDGMGGSYAIWSQKAREILTALKTPNV